MIRIIGTLAGIAWVVFMAWGAMREYKATYPEQRDRRAVRDRLLQRLRLGFSKRRD
jgi:hypothetical protein